MASMTVAEKIAEEIFRLIEREKRIIKGDLVEAAERILKMEAPNANAPQANPVPFVYVSSGSGGLGEATTWLTGWTGSI